MKRTEIIMGMPVVVMCDDAADIDGIFDFFRAIDKRYSPYIAASDVGKINRGELQPKHYSQELREILQIADKTKQESSGYFEVWRNRKFDPSGIVKGWAIQRAAELLDTSSRNFYIEAGGDIQVRGNSPSDKPWRIGIRNPFNRDEIIATVSMSDGGVATSGTAIRGQHIYNPFQDGPIKDILSISVAGPKVVDADRYATAAFAMGRSGINFIATIPSYEGYMVDTSGTVTMTDGWRAYENQ